MNRKKWVIVILAVLLLSGTAGWYVFVWRKNDSTQNSTSKDSNQSVTSSNEGYIKYQQDKFVELANDTTSLDELKKFSKSDQGKVGLELIDRAITSEDLDIANTYIDYLMTRQDNVGLDAALKCYQIAASDARKQQCVDNINKIAKSLGIIGQNEVLPKSYYDQAGSEQG